MHCIEVGEGFLIASQFIGTTGSVFSNDCSHISTCAILDVPYLMIYMYSLATSNHPLHNMLETSSLIGIPWVSILSSLKEWLYKYPALIVC